MAYATDSGTFDQMLTALVTFAKANGGFAAPASPGVKNYWRVVMSNYSGTNNSIYLESLDFRNPSSVSVGPPDTTLTNAEDASFPASGVWGGSQYHSGNSVLRPWVGGLWNAAVEVNEVYVEFTNDSNGRDPVDLVLEYSDDGSNWQTLTVFSAGGDYSNPITFTLDANAFPLTPGDNIIMGISKYQSTIANAGRTRFLNGGGTSTIYPTNILFPFGRSNIASTPFSRDDTLKTYIPTDETINEWHFFADTSISDHIHCAYSTNFNGETHWHHFSMGFIDNAGLTHNGVAFVICDGTIFWPNDTDSISAWLHKSLRNGNPFYSTVEYGADNETNASMWLFANSGGSGYPLADDGSWPERNVVHPTSSWLPIPAAIVNPREEAAADQLNIFADADCGGGWDCMALSAGVHPLSGFISLGTIPIACRTSVATQSELVAFLGQMPNMRFCRMDGLTAGDEITVGTDTWKIFPRLRKTTASLLDNDLTVGTGPAAWAYKKVV